MLRVVMTGSMNTGKTVFLQVMDLVHRETFQRCVHRYHSDSVFRSLSCRDQFLSMAFAPMTFRESLRDTVDCLEARSNALYHMGLRGPVRRSTLADANEQRDWHMYADLAQHLIGKARRLYANEPLAADLDATVYLNSPSFLYTRTSGGLHQWFSGCVLGSWSERQGERVGSGFGRRAGTLCRGSLVHPGHVRR